VDALEIPTADVVANSMGALLSVAFALDAPSRVSRLVLVGAPFGIARRPPLLMLPIGFPLIGPRLGRHLFSTATRDGSRKFWGQLMVAHPERVDDRLLDVDVAHTRRNVESMLSLIACIADWRRLGYRRELILGERWRALTMPTLLLWPEHDAFGSPKKGEALVATNPNLHLVRVPGAGHNAWFDDPETVVAEIERFLATEPRSKVEAVA
jgi:pimeloyl-ACP methyl ester carboxylesterase